jgi:hypothetical protein
MTQEQVLLISLETKAKFNARNKPLQEEMSMQEKKNGSLKQKFKFIKKSKSIKGAHSQAS